MTLDFYNRVGDEVFKNEKKIIIFCLNRNNMCCVAFNQVAECGIKSWTFHFLSFQSSKFVNFYPILNSIGTAGLVVKGSRLIIEWP